VLKVVKYMKKLILFIGVGEVNLLNGEARPKQNSVIFDVEK
jgi:hypothetical protein